MKIALIGYGKMGKEIEKIAIARGHEIVSIIDIDNQQDFESEAFKSADVAIEFTNPHVAYQNRVSSLLRHVLPTNRYYPKQVLRQPQKSSYNSDRPHADW